MPGSRCCSGDQLILLTHSVISLAYVSCRRKQRQRLGRGSAGLSRLSARYGDCLWTEHREPGPSRRASALPSALPVRPPPYLRNLHMISRGAHTCARCGPVDTEPHNTPLHMKTPRSHPLNRERRTIAGGAIRINPNNRRKSKRDRANRRVGFAVSIR